MSFKEKVDGQTTDVRRTKADQNSSGVLKLEDLKVLRCSPDLFNNVKIGQGQLPLILIKHILFYHWGLQPFWSSDLKQSNKYTIKQPSDF